jgi:hypothetical protein
MEGIEEREMNLDNIYKIKVGRTGSVLRSKAKTFGGPSRSSLPRNHFI